MSLEEQLIYDWNQRGRESTDTTGWAIEDLTPSQLSPGGVASYLGHYRGTQPTSFHLGCATSDGALQEIAGRLAALNDTAHPRQPSVHVAWPCAQYASLLTSASDLVSEGAVGLEVDLLASQQSSFAAAMEACRYLGAACRERGLTSRVVLLDAVRAQPALLHRWVVGSVESGVQILCLSDDSGVAEPRAVRSLMRFVETSLSSRGLTALLEWRGANERDLALANALEALALGTSRVHASMLGIGPRSGYAQLDLLLVNLALEGRHAAELKWLASCVEALALGLGQSIPVNYPVFGGDAFRTATGVHAAAIAKALARGDEWLADAVYSSVPASMVGRHQQIDIGPMSGESNVLAWMRRRGVEPEMALVRAVLSRAKASKHTLTDEDVLEILDSQRAQT